MKTTSFLNTLFSFLLIHKFKIFSLYENTNYKLDKEENFISLKNFIKLSKDYLVIPNFCRI